MLCNGGVHRGVVYSGKVAGVEEVWRELSLWFSPLCKGDIEKEEGEGGRESREGEEERGEGGGGEGMEPACTCVYERERERERERESRNLADRGDTTGDFTTNFSTPRGSQLSAV